ncbi:thioesterase family protein [Alkalicoccobacillus porphyridii]|uniref:Thioesterase n=1 Tax=Alkalicoccobacillus porphyridii TaxID=2597270 RepID=A0A554A197_9BACI|nr:thioesterase family protein [Alkalicoccobacillus porphyridii]TSB47470.1 hypothetical protein FN960_06970 [Alkalicoccobacillus porphyridii]
MSNVKEVDVWTGNVQEAWVDYNGHMNDAAYAKVFSLSLDALMAHIGLDATGIAKLEYTIFTLEAHIKYVSEVHQGQTLHVAMKLLDVDPKRMHLWFVMKDDQGNTVATSEQMVMGMDQSIGRPAPFPAEVQTEISKLPLLEKDEWPEVANQPMGIRRKR